jgi:hypothetical protein
VLIILCEYYMKFFWAEEGTWEEGGQLPEDAEGYDQENQEGQEVKRRQ